jgi:hypothetical protein
MQGGSVLVKEPNIFMAVVSGAHRGETHSNGKGMCRVGFVQKLCHVSHNARSATPVGGGKVGLREYFSCRGGMNGRACSICSDRCGTRASSLTSSRTTP